MHIPDGYLGPQTYGAAYVLAAPFWAIASQKLNKTLRSRQVPLLALGAAFSFVIMMFNVPIPGGTTGHAVGAVLVAVLLGPWAACVAVSIALIVQAFLFGDGGITAIGANCLNMAVIMPFVGYGVYRLISARSEMTSPRRWIGAAVGGYVGLNVAAVSAGIMFGIQPAIAHDAAGHALYAPYPLTVAVPAMAVEHLLLFGIVEAVVTGLVVAYLQRADVSLLYRAVEKTDNRSVTA
jgi:cobalt/nickel transport system permease protein